MAGGWWCSCASPLMRAGLISVLCCGVMLACAALASATPVFLTPVNVSDAGQDAFETQVAVDASGIEHHIWTRFDGANTRVQHRSRSQSGNFGPVQTLSSAGEDASQPKIDLDGNGDAVAVWTRFDGTHARVEAAVRLAGGSFGAPQLVSPAGQSADQPDVSVDSSGKAVAVWISYDAGTTGTGRIQAAVRPAGGSFGAALAISDAGAVTDTPQVESGPALDSNAVAIWSRFDGSHLRVQSSRRRDVTGFPRPRGASPLRASLAVAYNACTSPNRTHSAPLSFGACNPPVRSSTSLTVGTPDANGFAANAIGSVRYAVLGGNPATPADEADILISVGITDVRNHPSGADYSGRVLVTAPVRITDNANAPEMPEPGTTQAGPFQFPVQCAVTADTSRGGQCNLATSYEALVPGAVAELRRANWELGQVQVRDAGPNGTGYAACPPTCGDGDETVFMRQGIFIP